MVTFKSETDYFDETQCGGEFLAAVMVDATIITKIVVEMIIIDDLAFRHVDVLGFGHVMVLALPKFKLMPRLTEQGDCFGIFCAEERVRMS